MKEAAFRAWMAEQGNSPGTISTRISDGRRIEAHYGDLDEEYEKDRFASILETLKYSPGDRDAGRPNPSRLDIQGELYSSLGPYRSVLLVYSKFRDEESGGASEIERQADRIRAFIMENYVEPARRQGLNRFDIRSGDVHSAIGLDNHLPAVCSALRGGKLAALAGIHVVHREGPENGANVTYSYEFTASAAFGVAFAESVLRQRYGAPTAESQKMVAFAAADGREVALQRDIAKVQLWLEDDGRTDPIPAQEVQHYAASKGRHSNLPARLRHEPGQELRGQGFPKPVFSVRAGDAAELNAILDWYAGKADPFNRAALEQYKAAFLARFPDFEPDSFARREGGYYSEERGYKDALIASAQAALRSHLSNSELGGRLLDCLTGKESGLLGWRTDGRIKNLRAANPGLLERLAGELAMSQEDAPQATAKFIEQAWPALSAGQDKSLPYSESRNIPSMLLALVNPLHAYGINTEPVSRVYRALYGAAAFRNQPLTAEEYAAVLAMAHDIETVMRDEWGWQPRDLWDVQGFIWVIGRAEGASNSTTSDQNEQGARIVPATNLILYGPPGTGKTYATTEWAVRLCDGDAPDERAELQQRYESLVEAGQIGFVTFHQSYAYEDFVEGLRPQTDVKDDSEEVASGGFRLDPQNGIFREMALVAEQARTTPQSTGGFDLSGRNFIKMSLGRAGIDDHIYDAALEGDYIVLGWGGEVDWSDPRYENYDEVFRKWNEIEPQTSGNSGNIAQTWRFRGGLKPGDIVIVSEGNSHFRAIAEVTGDYQFEPTGVRTYNHRRAVKWLLKLDDPLPVDTIYDGKFTMMSCYELKQSKIKKEALARLLPSPEPVTNSPPRQFVLIIDEINRANISKVFGELITLLEPDKRLGASNALKVKLPYSKDSFGVPNNLHIIGTMNTADRSIALLDTALRRRFDFRELMPQAELLPEDVDGIPLRALLRRINERIEYLFDREHQIGHAYFIHCQTKTEVDRTMRDKVIPLLQEYFYEDWSKLALVLGDAAGEGRFIERKSLAAPAGVGDEYGAEDRSRWSVKEHFDTDAYAQFQ